MREQLSEYEIRLIMIKKCQEKIDSFELKINLPESLSESLTFSYDNLQNDPDLISAFKESVFLARELMDIIIKKLAYEFKGTISNKFTKFMNSPNWEIAVKIFKFRISSIFRSS